jgi:hypothetical protein
VTSSRFPTCSPHTCSSRRRSETLKFPEIPPYLIIAPTSRNRRIPRVSSILAHLRTILSPAHCTLERFLESYVAEVTRLLIRSSRRVPLRPFERRRGLSLSPLLLVSPSPCLSRPRARVALLLSLFRARQSISTSPKCPLLSRCCKLESGQSIWTMRASGPAYNRGSPSPFVTGAGQSPSNTEPRSAGKDPRIQRQKNLREKNETRVSAPYFSVSSVIFLPQIFLPFFSFARFRTTHQLFRRAPRRMSIWEIRDGVFTENPCLIRVSSVAMISL